MKTFGIILKAYTASPSALHSRQILFIGTLIPLSKGLFPLQKEVFLKSRKRYFIDAALYWPLKPGHINVIQNLELHSEAASLHSSALFIFRGGVREEASSRSPLNKLGNLLFLGGTFRLLVLAVGAGWGQRGESREWGWTNLVVWPQPWEPGTPNYHLGLAHQDAQCPSPPHPIYRLQSQLLQLSVVLWRLLTGSTLNQKEKEGWVE